VGVHTIIGEFISAVWDANWQIEEKGLVVISVDKIDGLVGK
jgi:hypothetical protein